MKKIFNYLMSLDEYKTDMVMFASIGILGGGGMIFAMLWALTHSVFNS